MSQVGFTDDGMINGVVLDVYTNSGCRNNDQFAGVAMFFIDNGTDICTCLMPNSNRK